MDVWFQMAKLLEWNRNSGVDNSGRTMKIACYYDKIHVLLHVTLLQWLT